MIYLFAAYVLALGASLFMASWRTAIWAVAAESLIAGLVLVREGGFASWPVRIQALDLLLFRAFVVPWVLVGILKKRGIGRELDSIPANFVIWAMALAVLVASYWFGQKAFPSDLQRSLHLGTATAGILTGLFVLANQSSAVGQLIGLLTLESGIVLTEVFGGSHERWFVQLGISLAFLWTVGLFWEFLRRFSELETRRAQTADGPRVEERDVL